MAYSDTDPSLDFDAQEQAMLQQAARIKALRGMDLSTTPTQQPGFTSAVTGAKFLAPQIKTPLLSALTPILQDTRAAYDENALTKQRSALNSAEQQNLMDWISKTPQGTPYSATPLAGHTGGVGGDLVQANVTPEAPASSQALLNHYAAGMKGNNPMVRDFATKGIATELFEAPKEARALKLAIMKMQAEAQEKALGRQNTLDAATIRANAPGKGSFTDGGLVDSTTGAKILVNAVTKETARSNPDGSVTVTSGPRAGQKTTLDTNGTEVAPGMVPPEKVDAGDRKTITAQGAIAGELQNIKSRYNANPEAMTSWQGKMIPNAVGQTGWAGDKAQYSAGVHADLQKVVNDKLLSQSGTAVTSTEENRQMKTMPNSFSDQESFNRWVDRSIALANSQAARTQALAQSKYNEFDVKMGAVVNKLTHQVVPGTESPFTQDLVEERVKAEGEPKWTGGETDPSKFDIRNPVDKALAQRAYANRGKPAATGDTEVDALVNKYRKK